MLKTFTFALIPRRDIFLIMINEQKEKRILLLSFVSGLLFAIAEFIFSIYSHSQSVLMDAVYDASELIFIALILFLTPLFYKPVSEKHPYGFFQVESIFLIIKVFMMLSVSFGVSAEIIESALSGGNPINEIHISSFQLFLGIISIIIYFVMKKMNNSLSSPTVNAELLGWKTDIAYSIGMSFAFFAGSFLKGTPLEFLSPYFDQIIAVIVMIFMLPESIKILWCSIKDVFLFSPDEETVNTIKDLCTGIMQESNFEPVFFDITRTGRHLWVAIYFEISTETLKVSDLKNTTDIINAEIKKTFDNCSCELILMPKKSELQNA